MEALTFFSAMNRGQFREEQGIEGSSYCIFFAPMEELVTQDRMTGREDQVVLELLYGDEMLPGALRVRQVGSNAVVEESTQGAFRAFLEEKPVKYIGQLLMYALQFKIQDLSLRIEGCTGEMKQLEDALDNCIDNSGTYRLLDFRRRYTECGNMVLAVKEILSRIDKGYYPMQMQNSYVLQGEVLLEFRFLEERYELIKSTVLKDFDTYTSIINNNINRNARLLSIISLVGVVLNFMFGSLLAANPLLGIIGGVLCLAFGAMAILLYGVIMFNDDISKKPGYLLFSTPRSAAQIVGAKLLMTLLALLGITVLFTLLIAVDVFLALQRNGTSIVALLSMFDASITESGLKDALFNGYNFFGLAMYILNMVISFIFQVITAYVVITLLKTVMGNQKGRTILAVILWFVIINAVSMLGGLFTTHLASGLDNEGEIMLTQESGLSSTVFLGDFLHVLFQPAIYLPTMLLCIAGSVAGYLLTVWMMEKKLSV